MADDNGGSDSDKKAIVVSDGDARNDAVEKADLPLPKNTLLAILAAAIVVIVVAISALLSQSDTSKINEVFTSFSGSAEEEPPEAGGLTKLRDDIRDGKIKPKKPRKTRTVKPINDHGSVMSVRTPPLIKAAVQCKDYEVEGLLDEGVEIDIRDAKGETALSWAVRRRCTKAVKILISRGANINSRANNGFTPYIWATTHNYKKIAKLLKDAGADTKGAREWEQSQSAEKTLAQ